MTRHRRVLPSTRWLGIFAAPRLARWLCASFANAHGTVRPVRSRKCPELAQVTATCASCAGTKRSKPDRSRRALIVMTPRVRRASSLRAEVDVTHASCAPWKKTVVHTSPPTTGPSPDTLGNSSKQGGIDRDQPVCWWGLGCFTDGGLMTCPRFGMS